MPPGSDVEFIVGCFDERDELFVTSFLSFEFKVLPKVIDGSSLNRFTTNSTETPVSVLSSKYS